MEKKVLLTNYRIKEFTGSELDTITMADYFLNNGYDVSIFTLEIGMPLVEKINSQIKIILPSNISQLENHYDLIWSHHWPLLDYILFSTQINVDYIHFHSLSSFEPYESFPVYYKDLTLNSVLSKMHQEKFIEDGIEKKYINIFSNYSYSSYFDLPIDINKTLKKVCIISNHVPNEILELKMLLENKRIKVDIYGTGYKYAKINEQILKKYDLIISIGKTINYGTSLGIPCYCYDRFGGDGYITTKNIELSYQNIFSGKAFHEKKNAQELLDDIIDNYNNCLLEQEKIRIYAFNNYCYENMMKKTLNIIYKSAKIQLSNIRNKYFYLKKHSKLFINEYLRLTEDHTFKIRFDFDYNGYNYEKSKTFNYNFFNNKLVVKELLELEDNCKGLKINFSNREMVGCSNLKINGKLVNPYNSCNCFWHDESLLALNNQACIIINDNFKKGQVLKVEMQLKQYDKIALFCSINNIIDVKEKLTNLINKKDEEIYRLSEKVKQIDILNNDKELLKEKNMILRNQKSIKLLNNFSKIKNKLFKTKG